MKPGMRALHLLAWNIRSVWNVGSLFRTCDAFAVEKIWLTGYTATPPRREISKTAIGAESFVAWEYRKEPLPLLTELRESGFHIVALEQHGSAKIVQEYQAPDRLCLIVGHEVLGVPQEILEHCDDIIAIPMLGKKESLNVAVAAGIALHHLRYCERR